VTPRTRGVILAAALGALDPGSSALAQQFKMPKVEVDFDKEVDFKQFKTYSWKDSDVVAEDPSMHARIVWYVERELEKKGLDKAKDGGTGDLLVRYWAKKRTDIVGTPSQSETTVPGGAGQLTTSVDLHTVLEGTLLIELQQAAAGKVVWRAETEYRSIDKQRIDAETKSAIRLLLARYPPPKP
jgi:hypothetical protein